MTNNNEKLSRHKINNTPTDNTVQMAQDEFDCLALDKRYTKLLATAARAAKSVTSILDIGLIPICCCIAQ